VKPFCSHVSYGMVHEHAYITAVSWVMVDLRNERKLKEFQILDCRFVCSEVPHY
jgi:hypothetical protein